MKLQVGKKYRLVDDSIIRIVRNDTLNDTLGTVTFCYFDQYPNYTRVWSEVDLFPLIDGPLLEVGGEYKTANGNRVIIDGVSDGDMFGRWYPFDQSPSIALYYKFLIDHWNEEEQATIKAEDGKITGEDLKIVLRVPKALLSFPTYTLHFDDLTEVKASCPHKWKSSIGLIRTYEDCELCGAKKEDVE